MARFAPRTFSLADGRVITIRPVEPTEAAAMLAFADHIDRTSEHNLTQPGERTMTVEQERDWLQKTLDDPGSINLGAYDADQIVGLINFKCGERRRIAHHGIFGISVHQSLRGHGIGTALIRALLDWATASPTIEKVSLGVFVTNTRAHALYKRMGFVEECRRRKFIKRGPGDYIDDIEMCQWVKPV